MRLPLLVVACAAAASSELAPAPAPGHRPALPRQCKADQLVAAGGKRGGAVPAVWAPPSYGWAILSNWLYFLSLGLNAVNVQYLVRLIVNADGSTAPSPAAIALSGRVETVDKLLTFLGVGLLSALSDVRGRKPLMAWSALGFAATNLLQASAGAGSIGRLYLADLIDGCSSCMTPICQAYVADCSPASRRAQNLGVSRAGRVDDTKRSRLEKEGQCCDRRLPGPVGGRRVPARLPHRRRARSKVGPARAAPDRRRAASRQRRPHRAARAGVQPAAPAAEAAGRQRDETSSHTEM